MTDLKHKINSAHDQPHIN